MKLSLLADKELLYSLFLSILSFIYSKLIIFIITTIPDRYLMYLLKPDIYIKLIDFDSDSDSDNSIDEYNNSLSNSLLNHNSLDEYTNYLKYWEYDVILHLFNLQKYSYNIISEIEKNKINKNYSLNKEYNSNLTEFYNSNNVITIVNCFLFNIKVSKTIFKSYNDTIKDKQNKCDIKLLSIIPFRFKLALYSYIYNNYINSSNLHKLFPNHKYLYIYYKKRSEYYSILIDLHNNYDITKHKKILFNKIKI